MATRKVRSVNKRLTDEDRVRHQRIREQIEREKPELMARGRQIKARHAKLREAVAALKATRESLGLSLADIRERTGIEKSNLSRLENAANPNPTIDTLSRYADAVGKEIVIALVDQTAPVLDISGTRTLLASVGPCSQSSGVPIAASCVLNAAPRRQAAWWRGRGRWWAPGWF